MGYVAWKTILAQDKMDEHTKKHCRGKNVVPRSSGTLQSETPLQVSKRSDGGMLNSSEDDLDQSLQSVMMCTEEKSTLS